MFNGAIQCLAHSPRLVDYFRREYLSKIEINHHREKKLWTSSDTNLGRDILKPIFEHIVPGLSIDEQQDAQEYLNSLLLGLHEGLNRVKYYRPSPAQFGKSRADEVTAEIYWNGYLACNDSIIVDLFEICVVSSKPEVK
ncbi:Ubiquitin carboxyl-terminal hydrolase 8-like protein [Drosera capensis]